MFTFITSIHYVCECLVEKKAQKKEIKGKQIKKEELSLFAGHKLANSAKQN